MYHKEFIKDVADIVCKTNVYDMCVPNNIINNQKHTLNWPVDGVKASHVYPNVKYEFYNLSEDTYISDELVHITVTRGKLTIYEQYIKWKKKVESWYELFY